MKNYVFTPLSIVLAIVFLISTLTAINGLFLNNEGGNSLGGGLALVFTIVIFGLLVLEQALVKPYKGSTRKIWIVELLLIAIGTAVLLINL